jgi:hypothetical protein|eukprot:COSAG03_NODE_1351_length_4275_cov_1.736590_2_plen_72_part_00
MWQIRNGLICLSDVVPTPSSESEQCISRVITHHFFIFRQKHDSPSIRTICSVMFFSARYSSTARLQSSKDQ